jgi:hypothetical protein
MLEPTGAPDRLSEEDDALWRERAIGASAVGDYLDVGSHGQMRLGGRANEPQTVTQDGTQDGTQRVLPRGRAWGSVLFVAKASRMDASHTM